MNKVFIFKLTNYDKEKLIHQIAQILEKYTELSSRKQLPQLWKIIDKLNPDGNRAAKSNSKFTRISAIICIIMGIILFVPGIVDLENNLILMIIGISGIIYGLLALYRSKMDKKDSYMESALTFLNSSQNYVDYQVQIMNHEMVIMKSLDDKFTVSKEDIQVVIESDDLVFIQFLTDGAILLQKKDLVSHSYSDFHDRISQFNFISL